MAARGPAGGRCRLGDGVSLRGQRSGGVMGAVGTVLRECVSVSAHFLSVTPLSLFSFLLALTFSPLSNAPIMTSLLMFNI